MTTSTWITGTSGLWTTTSNWSTGQVPGAGDTALITLAGNYLVSAPGSVTVDSLILDDASGEVSFGGAASNIGTLTVTAGLFTVAGSLDVDTLGNAGVIQNGGTIAVNNLNNTGTIDDTGTLTLSGIVLSNAGTINDANMVVVTGSVTSDPLARIGGTGRMVITGTVDNVGGTLGGHGPSLEISGGVVLGGTITAATIDQQNVVLPNTPTIVGVAVLGDVKVSGALVILDGLTGPAGSGPGTLDITTDNAPGNVLDFANAQTIDNMTVLGHGTIAIGPTLTIDSNAGITNASDLGFQLYLDGAGTIVNHGTILTPSRDNTSFEATVDPTTTIENADFENYGVVLAVDSSANVAGLPPKDGYQEGWSRLFITNTNFDNHAGGLIETGQSFGVAQIFIAASTNFINDGTLSTEDPTSTHGGTIDIAAFVQGSGTIEINGGGGVTLGSATSNTQIIDFLGAGGLTLADPAVVPAVIEGFNAADAILLDGVTATPISFSSGDLKLQTASGTLDLAITGDYALSDFAATSGGGNTVLTLQPSDTFTWISGTSGLWTTAADWSSDQVPGAGNTALIGAPGTYTITAPGTITVANLVVAVAEVSTSGTFTVLNALTNSGTIDNTGILSTGNLFNSGTIDNTGTLVLSGTESAIGVIDKAVIDNAGGTVINTGSVFLGGSIQGGTLVNVELLTGVLDGITVQGSLISIENVTILDGLTGVGTPSLSFDGLEFAGDQALAGISLVGSGYFFADNTLTVGGDAKISEVTGGDEGLEPLVFIGAGTIVNHGSIVGNSVDSIEFHDTLPPFGSSFSDGDASVSIENTDFENFGVIDASDLSGPHIIEISEEITPGTSRLDITAATFVNHAGGVIETGDASGNAEVVIAGTTDFVNDGTVTTDSHDTTNTDDIAGAVIDIAAAVTGSGTIVVDNGTVTVEGAVVSTQTVDFAGFTGTLFVGQPASMQAMIVGFNPVGEIVLNGVSATAISYTSGDLKLQTSTGTLDLNIAGTHSLSDFNVVAGPFATTIDAPPVSCLTAGTRVATDRGDVLVEQLQVGDIVMTGDGQRQAIQWIGHRDTDCRHHPDPHSVWPVRIAAHAFGPNQPRRALLLSPDHAVLVDDMLVPIKYLVNVTTIVQRKIAQITYYHVELPRHDVLLAEGLPVESYLETGGRTAFENAGEVMQLHPNFAPDPVRSALIWDSEGYAPLVVAPRQLAPIKERLQRQAEALEATRKACTPKAA